MIKVFKDLPPTTTGSYWMVSTIPLCLLLIPLLFTQKSGLLRTMLKYLSTRLSFADFSFGKGQLAPGQHQRVEARAIKLIYNTAFSLTIITGWVSWVQKGGTEPVPGTAFLQTLGDAA